MLSKAFLGVFFFLALIGIVFSASAPFVSITSPVSGASFTAPASVVLSATASSLDGSVTRVEFYNGSNLIMTINTPPYTYTWTNVSAGNYSITAKAFDDLGGVSTSSAVSIIVNSTVKAPQSQGVVQQVATQQGVIVQAANTCTGTCYYVRPSATGNGSGSDWGNAAGWSGVTFSRGSAGTTYYLADGNYAGKTLSTAASGTNVITIKKAISTDHGTDTGWSPTDGDGQATIGKITITSSYWTLDGQTGAGFSTNPPDLTPSDYGFACSDNTFPIMMGTGASNIGFTNITIKHFYALATSADVSDGFFYNQNLYSAVNNLTVSYCLLDGWGTVIWPKHESTWTGLLYEYNISLNAFSSSAHHGSCIDADSSSLDGPIIRYNYWRGGTGTALIEANNNNISNMAAYGNVFDNYGGSRIIGNGSSGIYIINSVSYNNTFLNCPNAGDSWFSSALDSEPAGPGGNIAYNNLIYNMPTGHGQGTTYAYNAYYSTTNTPTETGGQISTGNPFNNSAGYDYTLKANTTSGTPLLAPYNVDALGHTRTTWSRGAFEYQAATSSCEAVSPAKCWYVDSNVATSGNGTSWASAWKNISNIVGVGAGDIVYISGGPSWASQIYAMNGSWTPTSGTASAPITYKIGQDASHDGTAYFSGSGTWLSGSFHDVVISGDAGDGNMHFTIANPSNNVSPYGAILYVPQVAFYNVRISYVNAGSISGNIGSDSVIYIRNDAGVQQTGIEFDHFYIYVTNPSEDIAIHLINNNFTATWNNGFYIHDGTLYAPSSGSSNGVGSDFIQGALNGLTVTNVTFVGEPGAGGINHQDGVQMLYGSYVKINNNTFLNCGDADVYADITQSGTVAHWWVYNNVFLNPNSNSIWGIVFEPEGGIVAFSDIVVANNTIRTRENYANSIDLRTLSNGSTFTNSLVANNISIAAGNIIDSGVSQSNNLYISTDAAAANDFVNYSLVNSFSPTVVNMHAVSGATSIIDKGTSESSYFTTDKDGVTRPQGSAWDIGAYEFVLGGGNSLPSALITSPSSGAVFVAPANVSINVSASDANGSISKVEFYNGSTLLYTDLNAPYTYTWTNVPIGVYSLTAKAYDDKNAVVTSSPVSITVNNLAQNPLYRLNVTNSSHGTITSTPTGINCGGTCYKDFNGGVSVTLTAVADANYTFSGYSGACTGTTCTLTMDTNKNITATFIQTTSGGNWYVRSGVAGNGTSWTNAWSDVAGIVWSSIKPGDTIWIAGGSYGALSPGASGTADTQAGRIFVKRATAAAHGPDAGWNSAYDSQVVLSNISWNSLNVGNYVTIDGQVDSGIKISHGQGDGVSSVSFNRGVNFVTLSHLDLVGPCDVPTGCAHTGDDRGIDGTAWNGTTYENVQNLRIQSSKIHGNCTQIWIANSTNQIWENNEIYNSNTSDSTNCHPNIIATQASSNITFRNNKVHDYAAEGIMFLYGSAGTWNIYGNIWYGDRSVARMLSTEGGPNGPIYFYNNTVDGISLGNQSPDGTWVTGSAGRNNIYWGNTGQGTLPSNYDFCSGSCGGTNSISNGSNPFVNYTAKDYHIVSTVGANYPKDKGTNLGSNFSPDIDGTTRGADGYWDIGAFEFGGVSSPVDGVCGAMQYTCVAGSLLNQFDDGVHYLWDCNGLYGGVLVHCSVAKSVLPTISDGSVVSVGVDSPLDFNLVSTGIYRLVGHVAAGATDGSANSFCIDINSNPGSGGTCSGTLGDAAAWDILPTTTYSDQNVSWRGANALTCFDSNCAELNPKTFNLTKLGLNTLYVNTRESNSHIQTIKFVKINTPTTQIHPADTTGDYNISFSEYLAYANCWRNPTTCTNWNGTGNGVTMTWYLNAANLYRAGLFVYHSIATGCPPNAPSTCWVPGN